MAGGIQQCRNDSDHEIIFRQESNFHYMFGVAEADCFGTISVPDGEATLFIPRLPDAHALWMGAPLYSPPLSSPLHPPPVHLTFSPPPPSSPLAMPRDVLAAVSSADAHQTT